MINMIQDLNLMRSEPYVSIYLMIFCCSAIMIISGTFCKRLHSHWSRAGLHLDHLVFCLVFVRYHPAENGPIHRKMVDDCPLVITSKVKQFSRPGKTRKKEFMVQTVFCIVDTGSCFHSFQASRISSLPF